MGAFLLKDLEFKDLQGAIISLPKGTPIMVDKYDEKRLLVASGPLVYMVKVELTDYCKFNEMN